MSENDRVDSILIFYPPLGSQHELQLSGAAAMCLLLSPLTGPFVAPKHRTSAWLAFVLYMCLFSLTE